MILGQELVAVVPVRMGSKRLPGKNLRPIYLGETLLSYAVKKLLKVSQVDMIIVTSESDEVYSHLRTRGLLSDKVAFHKRDAALADDSTFIMPVVRDALRSKRAFGYVLVTQVDNPSVTAADFHNAIGRFINDQSVDVLISVGHGGEQTGQIRLLKTSVINRPTLECIHASMHTEYPNIDIHFEQDLIQAQTEVEYIESKANGRERLPSGIIKELDDIING